MKNLSKKLMKKNEGITLIALIITIIILIILTAITINNVIGTDLIGFATKAAENYTDAGKKEEEEIDKLVGVFDNAGVGDESKVRAGKIVTETEKDNYTDAEGRTATIPAGFKVSTKASEQYIKDGLVIQDTDGNEFVWVPCTEEQYREAADDIIDEDWARQEVYDTNGGIGGKAWRDNYTSEGELNDLEVLNKSYTGGNALPTNTWENNQPQTAITSIKEYEGFYIARYEAGIPEEASFHISNTDNENGYVNVEKINFSVPWSSDAENSARGSIADTNSIKNLKPVSKQGTQVWNYITQPNAKVIAENMYKDGMDSKGNEVDVGSFLVDGMAWNHICKNIYEVQSGKDTNDSATWGNYYDNKTTNYKGLTCLWAGHAQRSPWQIATEYKIGGITDSDYPKGGSSVRVELSAGSSNDFKKYNIYDMAGNMYEWTTSHNVVKTSDTTMMYAVPRGGCFCSVGATEPVVYAKGDYDFVGYSMLVGFRVVLYVKPV